VKPLIDLVAGAAVWRVPGFEVDSFVHEVRALDRHLSASRKVDKSDFISEPLLYRRIEEHYCTRV
jgi:hypothetical protein